MELHTNRFKLVKKHKLDETASEKKHGEQLNLAIIFEEFAQPFPDTF